MGCFRFFSLDFNFGSEPVVVGEGGEVPESVGISGNAEMGEVEDDDGDGDRKRAVKGLTGVVGLAF